LLKDHVIGEESGQADVGVGWWRYGKRQEATRDENTASHEVGS
jgi:hypothetical protein